MNVADRTDANLNEALAHTTGEIARTDTKSGLLLTLDGLLVAALGLTGTDLHGLALVLAVVGAVALVGSVVLALLVIRPRLAGGGIDDRASFAFYADAADDAITAALSDDRRRTRLKALSRLARRKMRLLIVAGDAALAALVLIAAAILTR